MPSVKRVVAVMAMLMLTAFSAAQAREVTLKLTNGQTVSGTLVSETADAYTVRVGGVERTIPRSQVAGTPTFQLGIAEQYQQQRQQIANDDYGKRYQLAESIYRQAEELNKQPASRAQATQGYQIALRELQSILQDNPEMAQATLLRDVVTRRIAESGAPAPAPAPGAAPGPGPRPVPPGPRPAPGPAPAPAPAPGPGAAPAAMGEPRLLTEEEMNLIRVYEVNLNENPKPRIQVPREIIDKLIQQFRDAPEMQPFIGREGEAKLRVMDGADQLALMFDLRARDLYKDVLIRTEPQSLQDYRVRVHNNYLVKYCGTCHGEGKAKGLYVITKNAQTPQVAYTNLLLLRTTPTKNMPLLFSEQPERSLLVQYGLPTQDAITPHPEVDQPGMKWRPRFQGRDDRNLQEITGWIQSIFRDEYPIQFQNPVPPPAQEPAPVPAQPERGPAPVGLPVPGAAKTGAAGSGPGPATAPKSGAGATRRP